MTAARKSGVSRRRFLSGSGSLIVSFSLLPEVALAQQAGPPHLPGNLQTNPMLDAWIRISADNQITVYTGKAELGQGTKTSLLQIAAEHLDVDPEAIDFITADTGRTPNEGYTAGSATVSGSGTALMNAAAQVRQILIDRAAQLAGLPADRLRSDGASVHAPDGRSWTYGALVEGVDLHVRARPVSKLKDPKTYKIVGTSMPRVDIPAKVTGGVAYVQDLRLEGMVHARVVRPPRHGARLIQVDTARVEKMPGVVKLVRNGSYLAVVAEKEFQAIRAMQALEAAAKWDMGPDLPADQSAAWSFLETAPAQTDVIVDRPLGQPVKTIEARYARPYVMHGSIGPSCALAVMQDGELTVWSHTQGVFPDRQAIAELLGMREESVRVIHTEGSGCYGHNGADDAAADAALIAAALPGRPVRVQWMRQQEHGWEPYGTAMTTVMRGGVDASGAIVAWDYQFWSQTHATRPGGAGSTIAGWLIEKPFALPTPTFRPSPRGSADRNAVPYYRLPGAKVTSHFIATPMPLRISALRSLGGYMNVFAIESFMDELALAAKADPVSFRLKHLDDPRASDVVKLAAEKFGWKARTTPPPIVVMASPSPATKISPPIWRWRSRWKSDAQQRKGAAGARGGRRRQRHRGQSGRDRKPDPGRHHSIGQLDVARAGGFRSHSGITSTDWNSYPILRFREVPDSIAVHVIDRPGQPFLGTGEAAQGPAGAAIANAIAHATGARLRVPPFTPETVKRAIGA